jgi:hypothetical protein
MRPGSPPKRRSSGLPFLLKICEKGDYAQAVDCTYIFIYPGGGHHKVVGMVEYTLDGVSMFRIDANVLVD